MSGPKPRPSHLKIVSGETRPSRVNYDEPQVEGELPPDPPKRLTPSQKAVWKELAAQVYWSKEIDRYSFELLCCALGDVRQLRGELKREKAIIKGSRGRVRNPKSYLLKEATEHAIKLLGEFGLSPSSRTKVKVPKGQQKKDPLAGLDR